jgi:tRNA1Val (adenine37-N6)-methyltransferase
MSGSNIFNFKRFTIDQNGCAMKVGTDGVLLGAWCRIDPLQDKAILDIGTGTGLIALQLAQRINNTNATIEAIEIDIEACNAAERNFAASPWVDRLTLHRASVQEFARTVATASTEQKQFDHIVSNPPYFANSLTSPDTSRNFARHTQSLSYDDLMKYCSMLLKPDGRVSLIVPAGVETQKMIATAETNDLRPTRRTDVHTTIRSGSKRTLLEFMQKRHAQGTPYKPLEADTLIIEGSESGTFSPEYRALTRDFYLYF